MYYCRVSKGELGVAILLQFKSGALVPGLWKHTIIHVTKFIQSLTYISFHSNICLLVCEQFNGEWLIRSLYLGLVPCC